MANMQKETKTQPHAVHKSKMTHSFISRAEQQGCLSKRQAAIIKRFEHVNRIDEWEANGLIDAEQRDKLYQLAGVPGKPQENKIVQQNNEPVHSNNSPFWVRRMSLFAIGCIVVGIIAVIAANWQQIPDGLKLGGYFAGFIAFISALFCADLTDRKWVKECLVWANIGWVFAGIGLIGQVYHLMGSFWNALLLGSVLSTPYIVVSSLRVSLPIWIIAYFLGVIWGTDTTYLIFWALAILPIVLWKRDRGIVCALWQIAFVYAVIQTRCFSDFIDYFMPVTSLWLSFVVLLGLIALCRRLMGVQTAFTKTLQYLTGGLFIFSVIAVDAWYTYFADEFSGQEYKIHSVWGLFFGAIAALVLIYLFVPKKSWMPILKIWAVSLMIVFVYNFLSNPIFGMIFTLICLMAGSIYAARKGHVWIFNLCLIAMVLRIIIAYGSYIVSLMSTGIGLIAIGVIMLAGIWFFYYAYPALVQKIKEVSHE